MNPSGIDANESIAPRSSGPSLKYLQRYGLAVVSISVALGISLILQHFHFHVPSAPLLLFAVAISSWYGGLGPAVLAVILSITSFYWYFVEPVRTIYIYWSEIPYFIIFAAFAALLSWFGTVRRRGEADLREQAALLNLTHDTVFVMDMEGVIRYWNRGAEERYGWTADQALGKGVHDLLKTVFPAALDEIKAEVTRAGRWEGELLHTKKDGSQLVAASRWSLERGKQGEPVAILETNNNITERKRTEEALRRLNRELRALSNCNQTLLRATDEQSLLERICRIVCEDAGYSMAWVGYAEHDEAKSVRPVAWTGAEEGYLASAGITWADTDRGHGQTGTAIRSGKSCCIQDFAMDARLAPWREGLLQRGFRSGIALPLKDENDNAFGSLTIHSAQPNAFTSEEIRLLEELAGDMAFGIVTLRSRAARERAKQEVALLSFALDKVREGAFLVDETGRYHYANDEGCRVLGYTRAELLGMSVADIDPEFPAERWSDHWRELKTQRSLNFESRHRTRDGRIFPVEVSANYFEYGGRAYNLALVRDITERKRAEEALRRSEVYLAEAQRLSHTGSWALDAASREYSYWSDEMFRIFGVDAHGGIPIRETMGRRIHPEDAGRATAGFEKSLREKVDTSDEYRFVLPDGKVKHIQSVRHPVLNDAGDVVQLVGTFVDITERKRAEEALRKAQADLAHVTRVVTMGELVASIAHEVNQPLTGVVAHAGTCLRWLAAQPPDLEEARHALELIVRDGKRANEVIGRIRGLVKKVPPRRDPMDVNTVILEVIALTTSELQRNHVDLRTHLASHLPLVPADRIQLQQVILNLVVNAIEAMSGVGDRPRELVVDSGEDDSNDVFVEVRDSGPGLDPANLPRLFDSFYTTKPEGMGMGLSISRSIIEAHGGRLQATANLPHGAVFRFTLPAEGDKAP